MLPHPPPGTAALAVLMADVGLPTSPEDTATSDDLPRLLLQLVGPDRAAQLLPPTLPRSPSELLERRISVQGLIDQGLTLQQACSLDGLPPSWHRRCSRPQYVPTPQQIQQTTQHIRQGWPAGTAADRWQGPAHASAAYPGLQPLAQPPAGVDA